MLTMRCNSKPQFSSPPQNKMFVRIEEKKAKFEAPTDHKTVCHMEAKRQTQKKHNLNGLAKITDWQNLSVQGEPSAVFML